MKHWQLVCSTSLGLVFALGCEPKLEAEFPDPSEPAAATEPTKRKRVRAKRSFRSAGLVEREPAPAEETAEPDTEDEPAVPTASANPYGEEEGEGEDEEVVVADDEPESTLEEPPQPAETPPQSEERGGGEDDGWF